MMLFVLCHAFDILSQKELVESQGQKAPPIYAIKKVSALSSAKEFWNGTLNAFPHDTLWKEFSPCHSLKRVHIRKCAYYTGMQKKSQDSYTALCNVYWHHQPWSSNWEVFRYLPTTYRAKASKMYPQSSRVLFHACLPSHSDCSTNYMWCDQAKWV